MSLQLYRTEDNNYLLDFQNLATKPSERLRPVDESPLPENENTASTHSLEFFELCAMLIAVGRHPYLVALLVSSRLLQELGR